MKCKHCSCPIAVPYVADNGTYCDNVCSLLDDEAQQKEFPSQAVQLTPAELNQLMDS
jgi:hypothetical protein